MSVWTKIYRLLAALLCLIGLGIQFGLQEGRFDAYLLNYFTVQSNLVCLALWVALVIRPTLSPTVRGVAAQGILLTMTVFHFLLSGGSFVMGDSGLNLFQIANLLLHYVCPTLMILDFLLLGGKKAVVLACAVDLDDLSGGIPGLCFSSRRDRYPDFSQRRFGLPLFLPGSRRGGLYGESPGGSWRGDLGGHPLYGVRAGRLCYARTLPADWAAKAIFHIKGHIYKRNRLP